MKRTTIPSSSSIRGKRAAATPGTSPDARTNQQGIHSDAFFFAPSTLTRADFTRYFLDEIPGHSMQASADVGGGP